MVRPTRRPTLRDADPLVALLRYLSDVEAAVLAHDSLRITSLLRKRKALHLPRVVREELLANSRMAHGTLRAPIQFLRFQHRMLQLAAGGEPMLSAQTELSLEPRASAGVIRREDRRAAAARGVDGQGGPDADGTEDAR